MKCDLNAGPTTTPQAPASIAAGANSPPSARSPRRPKKRSPAPVAPESIVARRGGPGAPSASTSAPSAAAICSASRFMSPRSPLAAAAAQQLLAGDLAIVERDLAAVLELLALLVALAGDHHGVAGPGSL